MRSVRRFAAIVALACATVALTLPSARAQTPADCALPGVDDKCELWTASYDDPELGDTSSQSPQDLAVSPTGDRIYEVLNSSITVNNDFRSRWTVIAYDATGGQAWVTKWGDPTHFNFVTSVEVAPSGDVVYVSGTSREKFEGPGGRMVTLALDAASGDIVWESTFDAPGGSDNAREIVVSPDGRSLYIAVISPGPGGGNLDYVMLEYDAATGAEQWATRWDGIGVGNSDSPFDIVLNKRGSMAYITGWSDGEGAFNLDFGTIAVHTTGPQEGAIAWSARYDGVGSRVQDRVWAIDVSPDGSKVFVTGMYNNLAPQPPPYPARFGYATVAYDAHTGAQLWEVRKHWDGSDHNEAFAIAVDPSGQRVLVTGLTRQASPRQTDFMTVAYDTATGSQVWTDRYAFPDADLETPRAIVMDPDGETVYVTGVSSRPPPGLPCAGCALHQRHGDQLTIAYDVATGQRRWQARYNAGGESNLDSPEAMAVSPDGTRIYVASTLDKDTTVDGFRAFVTGEGVDDRDAGLVAYDIGLPIPPPASDETTVAFTQDSKNGGQYSDETFLEASLTDSDGLPIAGEELVFQLTGEDGSRAHTATTNEFGIASVSPTLQDRPAAYDLTVGYAGNDSYEGSTATARFVIDKEDTAIELSLSDKGSKRTLRARLSDADTPSFGIEGRTIDFYADGTHLGSATTDHDGVAALSPPPRYRGGKHDFEARFAGDDYYRQRP